MNSDNQHPHMLSFLKDVVVFSITVTALGFFLTAACTVTKQTEMNAYAPPVLAMPQPPATLELASGAASTFPIVETAPVKPSFDAGQTLLDIDLDWAPPVFDVCLAFPEIEVDRVRVDTPAELSPAPAGGLPNDAIPFHGIIIQVAGRYEVDPHLIRAIILAESGYNPKAKSKKGARGLMQLMPSTAKSLGVEDIYDPEENIDGGVRYFRSLLDRFDGDVQLALAAYNAGSRHVRNYEGIPPFKATQRYIKKVLKFHKKFKMQKTAGSRRLA